MNAIKEYLILSSPFVRTERFEDAEDALARLAEITRGGGAAILTLPDGLRLITTRELR